MFAKYIQFSPFPSSLNSCPAPMTSSAFNPNLTGGFQSKYSFVSAIHTQAVLCKIWSVKISSRKTLSQAVKCYAYKSVLWICCLNLHSIEQVLGGKLESSTSMVFPVTSVGSQSIAVRTNYTLPIFHRHARTSHWALPSPWGIVFTFGFPGV